LEVHGLGAMSLLNVVAGVGVGRTEKDMTLNKAPSTVFRKQFRAHNLLRAPTGMHGLVVGSTANILLYEQANRIHNEDIFATLRAIDELDTIAKWWTIRIRHRTRRARNY